MSADWNRGNALLGFYDTGSKNLCKNKTEIKKLGNGSHELLETSYINQMKHFVEIIEMKAEPRMSLQNGIKDTNIALKILKEVGRNYN